MFSLGTTTSSVNTFGASFAVAPNDERREIQIRSSSSFVEAVCIYEELFLLQISIILLYWLFRISLNPSISINKAAVLSVFKLQG